MQKKSGTYPYERSIEGGSGIEVLYQTFTIIIKDGAVFKHETEKRFIDAMEKDTNYFEKYLEKLSKIINSYGNMYSYVAHMWLDHKI